MDLIKRLPFCLVFSLFLGCSESKITSPTPNSMVNRTIKCEGIIASPQKGKHFWLFVEELDSSSQTLYWPKEPEIIPDRFGHFSVEIFEDGIGENFTISLFSVEESGQKLIINWLKTGAESGNYPPMKDVISAEKLSEVKNLKISKSLNK